MKTFLSTACAVALMTSPRPPLPPTHGRMKAARGSGKGVMGRRVRATRRGGIVRGIKSPRVTPPPVECQVSRRGVPAGHQPPLFRC